MKWSLEQAEGAGKTAHCLGTLVALAEDQGAEDLTHTYTHTNTNTHTHTYSHTHIHTHAITHTHTHIHTHT